MTREGWWVFIGVALVLATTCGRCVAGAQRQPDDDVLQLSRMVISEAGYHPGRETFAILHVLEWRRTHLPAFAGWDIVRMGRAYCSGFGGRRHTENPHVLQAKALQWVRVPQQVREDVSRFLRNPEATEVRTPCRGAVHWRDQRVPAQWERLRVSCAVPTQNVYFGGEP